MLGEQGLSLLVVVTWSTSELRPQPKRAWRIYAFRNSLLWKRVCLVCCCFHSLSDECSISLNMSQSEGSFVSRCCESCSIKPSTDTPFNWYVLWGKSEGWLATDIVCQRVALSHSGTQFSVVLETYTMFCGSGFVLGIRIFQAYTVFVAGLSKELKERKKRFCITVYFCYSTLSPNKHLSFTEYS